MPVQQYGPDPEKFNGILLPIVLVIMLRLINDRSLMGDYVNSPRMNLVAWVTVSILIALTAMLLVTSVMR